MTGATGLLDYGSCRCRSLGDVGLRCCSSSITAFDRRISLHTHAHYLRPKAGNRLKMKRTLNRRGHRPETNYERKTYSLTVAGTSSTVRVNAVSGVPSCTTRKDYVPSRNQLRRKIFGPSLEFPLRIRLALDKESHRSTFTLITREQRVETLQMKIKPSSIDNAGGYSICPELPFHCYGSFHRRWR